ncbi:MAG: hypothetical protein FWE30_04875 [Bacteroidales bacterium]|nr:hypothetical protein [Bacteroidales bacterium]
MKNFLFLQGNTILDATKIITGIAKVENPSQTQAIVTGGRPTGRKNLSAGNAFWQRLL